jgi:hypothetical protein
VSLATESADRVVVGGDQAPIAGIVFDVSEWEFKEPSAGKRFFFGNLFAEKDAACIGLHIQILLTGWERELVDGEPLIVRYRGDVRMLPFEESTKRLLCTMENAWELPNGEGCFSKLFCESIAFQCEPCEIENKKLEMRIFFGNGESAESDVSLFLFIDLPNKQAWFSEKDTGYRQGIMNWFRGRYQ